MANNYGVYDRLAINQSLISGHVEPLGESSNNMVSTMPPMLNSWQSRDLGDGIVSGYFQNPTESYASNIANVAIDIISACSGASGLTEITNACTPMATTIANFIAHGNRISGVSPLTPATATLPHYGQCVALGKSMTYLTSQTDGINDNSPILACFTTILCGEQLDTYLTTISPYPQTILNSIQEISDGEGGYTYSSNLSSEQITLITDNLNAANNFMVLTVGNDVAHFTNMKTILDEMNTLKQFSDTGQSEDYILNIVGTTKLKSRLGF